jgi:HNH endonuclease
MARPKSIRNCDSCGSAYQYQPYDFARGMGRYCSKACSNHSRQVSEDERFWALANKTDGCWLWTAARDKYGYGVFTRNNGRWANAHRVAWEKSRGSPPEQQVLHTCDVRHCVRPDHLWTGTHDDNHADKTAKKRGPRGTRHPFAKLTWENARLIRQRYASGESQVSLGREYGVSQAVISGVVLNKIWVE